MFPESMAAVPTYSLRFEPREGYLFAQVSADKIDIDIVRGYLREVADECHERGFDRCIVVRDIPGVFDDSGQFGIAQEAARLFDGIRICWVNPYGDYQDSLDFATLVATNRGANFGMFGSEADAEAWLLGK